MTKRQKRLKQDLFFLLFSVAVAVLAVKTGLVDQLIAALDGWRWLGVFVAGSFFTSVFTTAPSIAILGTMAQTTPLPALALLGGLGAMLGDYLIFYFVRSRVAEDVKYLLSFAPSKRFRVIFHTHLFKFFLPFLGALIIASPFPDELGITMLGLSKIRARSFLMVSFIFNSIGILIIGWLARLVA